MRKLMGLKLGLLVVYLLMAAAVPAPAETKTNQLLSQSASTVLAAIDSVGAPTNVYRQPNCPETPTFTNAAVLGRIINQWRPTFQVARYDIKAFFAPPADTWTVDSLSNLGHDPGGTTPTTPATLRAGPSVMFMAATSATRGRTGQSPIVINASQSFTLTTAPQLADPLQALSDVTNGLRFTQPAALVVNFGHTPAIIVNFRDSTHLPSAARGVPVTISAADAANYWDGGGANPATHVQLRV